MLMRWTLVLLLFLAPLAACSSDPSPEEAFCDDLDDLRSSLGDLGKAVTSLNIDDVRSSLDDVETDVNNLRESAQELQSQSPESASTLQSDFQQLRSAISAVGEGGGANLVTQLRGVQTALTQFTTTLGALIDQYDCK